VPLPIRLRATPIGKISEITFIFINIAALTLTSLFAVAFWVPRASSPAAMVFPVSRNPCPVSRNP
jgi:hypothetical protein